MLLGFIRRPSTENPISHLRVVSDVAKNRITSQIQAHEIGKAPKISWADRLIHRSTHQQTDKRSRTRNGNAR